MRNAVAFTIMCFEGVFGCVRVAALATLMRLDGGMGEAMGVKSALLGERSVTLVTSIRLLASMCAAMNSQFGLTGE